MKKLLPLFILFLSLSALGQRKTAVSAFINTPFDETAKELPSNYKGIDFLQFFKYLSERTKKEVKDQFETTAMYEARLKQLENQPIFASLYKSSLLAFVPTEPKLKFSYDADKEILTVKLYCDSYRTFNQRTIETKRSTYTSSNALGVKVNVQKGEYQRERFFLDMTALPTQFSEKSDVGYSADLKLKPVDAKLLMANLKVALIGRIFPSYASTSIDYNKPTLSLPYEIIYYDSVIHLKLEQIWFFDMKGRVYARAHQS